MVNLQEKYYLQTNTYAFIDKIMQNVLGDKKYVEQKDFGEENFIVMPLKNNYFTKNLDSNKNAPLQYLLLVENVEGSIERGDVILFYPKNPALESLPEKTFYNFFQGNPLTTDGTFALITLDDVLQYEMDFYNVEPTELRLWEGRQALVHSPDEECIEWYLVTTVYYTDGHIEVFEQYLYTICENPGGGGGGAGPTNNPTLVNKNVELIVGQSSSSNECWKLNAIFCLKGWKFQNISNNYFQDINYVPSYGMYICPGFFHGVLNQISYIVIESKTHNQFLTNPKNAFGSASTIIRYPNQGHMVYPYSNSKSWNANIL